MVENVPANCLFSIDQPRLKRTFEVILFFEVINNLKGVII